VLEEQHQRVLPGAEREDGSERFQQDPVKRLALQVLGYRVPLARYGEQVEREPRVRAQPGRGLVDATDDALGGILPACAMAQPEMILQSLDEGLKGLQAAARGAVALQDGGSGHAAAKLVQQTALAQPGLAHDRNDLAVAGPGTAQTATERLQLL